MSEPKKRGRKPINKIYFGPEQEDAVARFLVEEDYEIRNDIYNKHLRHPLNKMIESIIRRYKLYRSEYIFEDLHHDTLSFLITKFDKFKPEKGKKSYSYFGTICKNYLLGQLIKSNKNTRTVLSYEDLSPTVVETNPDLVYSLEDNSIKDTIPIIMKEVSNAIQSEMDDNTNLKDNEIKVGEAIVYILKNWETVFGEENGNNKYNKNLILYEIREMTALTTKEIRSSMRKYKQIYYLLREEIRENG